MPKDDKCQVNYENRDKLLSFFLWLFRRKDIDRLFLYVYPGNDRHEQSYGPPENSENDAGVHKTECENGHDRRNE